MNDFKLLQLLRPHTAPITQIATNSVRDEMVSCSEDQTIFIHRITSAMELIPCGFVNVNAVIRTMEFLVAENTEVRQVRNIVK